MPEKNLEIVDLAALLHDIDDWKYASDKETPTKRAVAFLQSENVPSDKIKRVMDIIDTMGFKDELGGKTMVRFVPLRTVVVATNIEVLLSDPSGIVFCGVRLRPGRRQTGIYFQ